MINELIEVFKENGVTGMQLVLYIIMAASLLASLIGTYVLLWLIVGFVAH